MRLQLISQTVRPTTAITRNHLSLSHELLAYLVAAIAITIAMLLLLLYVLTIHSQTSWCYPFLKLELV
jgi:hypothetical protein